MAAVPEFLMTVDTGPSARLGVDESRRLAAVWPREDSKSLKTRRCNLKSAVAC
jgi:hypothetical protein